MKLKASTGAVSVIGCKGGPLDGQQRAIGVRSRLYWYMVDGRLVANTDSLEWYDLDQARGIYARHTQGTREILIYRQLKVTT